MMITAHSGCEGTRPDSIESIERGIAICADAVEIDIRRGETGELVLSHDKENAVKNAVLLKDAFSVIAKAGIAVNCDLKEYAILKDVLKLAQSFDIGRDRLIFSGSVYVPLLEEEPSIVKQAQIFLNIEEITPYCAYSDAAKKAKALGAAAVNLPYLRTSVEDAQKFIADGMGLSMWTVDDSTALALWGRMQGVVNITAKKALQAIKVLRG